jgi:hypothetical protein
MNCGGKNNKEAKKDVRKVGQGRVGAAS